MAKTFGFNPTDENKWAIRRNYDGYYYCGHDGGTSIWQPKGYRALTLAGAGMVLHELPGGMEHGTYKLLRVPAQKKAQENGTSSN